MHRVQRVLGQLEGAAPAAAVAASPVAGYAIDVDFLGVAHCSPALRVPDLLFTRDCCACHANSETKDKKAGASDPLVQIVLLAHSCCAFRVAALAEKKADGQSLTIIDNRTGKKYEIPIWNNTISAVKMRALRGPDGKTGGLR